MNTLAVLSPCAEEDLSAEVQDHLRGGLLAEHVGSKLAGERKGA